MALQSGKVTIVDQAEVMHEMKIIELGLKCNAIKSKGEGKRLVKNGGLYINNMRVEDINEVFDVEKHLIQDEFVMLRIGKKSQYILKIS